MRIIWVFFPEGIGFFHCFIAVKGASSVWAVLLYCVEYTPQKCIEIFIAGKANKRKSV